MRPAQRICRANFMGSVGGLTGALNDIYSGPRNVTASISNCYTYCTPVSGSDTGKTQAHTGIAYYGTAYHVETAEMTIIPDAQKSTFPVNVAIQMSRDYSVIMTLTIKSDSETHYVPFVLSLSTETYESAEPTYTQLDEYESLRQFDLIIGNEKNPKYKISSKVSQKFYYEKVTEEYTEVSWHYSSLNKGSE